MADHKTFTESSGFKEALKAYKKQMGYWLEADLTPDEIFSLRRSFVSTYEKELSAYGEFLFGSSTSMGVGLQDVKDEMTLEMMKDFRFHQLDRAIEKAASSPSSIAAKGAADRKSSFMDRLSRQNLETSAALNCRAKKISDPLSDTSITPAQRDALKEFQKWLYDNCDHCGFEAFGSAGSVRAFANEFSRKPAHIQLKALYLLETNNRKSFNDQTKDAYAAAALSYTPNLSAIKDRMVATRFKFWRRFDGTQYYWSKLTQSLAQAEKMPVQPPPSVQPAPAPSESKTISVLTSLGKKLKSHLSKPSTYGQLEKNTRLAVKGRSAFLEKAEDPFLQSASGIAAAGTAASLLLGTVDLVTAVKDGQMATSSGVKTGIGLAKDVDNGVKTYISFGGAKAGMSAGAVKTATGIMGAAAFGAMAAANTVDVVGKGLSRMDLTKAEHELASLHSDIAAAKPAAASSRDHRVVARAEKTLDQLSRDTKTLRFLTERSQRSAARNAVINGSSCALSAAAVACPVTAPVLLAASGALQVGNSIIGTVADNKTSRLNAADVSDTLGSVDAKDAAKIAGYHSCQTQKAALFKNGSELKAAADDAARKAAADPDLASRHIRLREAVKQGAETVKAYAERKLDSLADRIVRGVYLLHPDSTSKKMELHDPANQTTRAKGLEKKTDAVSRMTYESLLSAAGVKKTAVKAKTPEKISKELEEKKAAVKKKLSGMMSL